MIKLLQPSGMRSSASDTVLQWEERRPGEQRSHAQTGAGSRATRRARGPGCCPDAALLPGPHPTPPETHGKSQDCCQLDVYVVMETGWASGYRRATVSFTQAVITMPCTPGLKSKKGFGVPGQQGFRAAEQAAKPGRRAGAPASLAYLTRAGSVLDVRRGDEGPVLVGNQGNAGVQGLRAQDGAVSWGAGQPGRAAWERPAARRASRRSCGSPRRPRRVRPASCTSR